MNEPEEILKSLKPTHYEIDHDIKIISYEIVRKWDDIAIGEIKKSDNSITLVLLFKNSTKNADWVYWIPSIRQFEVLMVMDRVIAEVEEHNQNARIWQKK